MSTFANIGYNPNPPTYNPQISNMIGMSAYTPKSNIPNIPQYNEISVKPPQQILTNYQPFHEVGYTSDARNNNIANSVNNFENIGSINSLGNTVVLNDVNNYQSVPIPQLAYIPGITEIQYPQYQVPNSGYYEQNNNIDVDALISRLLTLSGATDDESFDIFGWRKFYPPEDSFFAYEHGPTLPDQVQVSSPENLENCEVFTGETNANGIRDGFGILYTSKYVRRGEFRNGEFTGWGREGRYGGEFYEGKFENGILTGKGIHRNKKGYIYQGDFVNKRKNGQGDLTSDNIHYIGSFRDDKLNGRGHIEYLKEGHTYDGDFRDNEIYGKGIFKWSNGDVYDGPMEDGKMHGRGKYIHFNGQIYEGDYRDGLKDGYGKLTNPDGSYYQGNFKNGLPDGRGLYVSKNGKKSNVEFIQGNVVKGGYL